MDISSYLARIGLNEPLAPTLENLGRLQKAHLFRVPYENLDILAGKPLSLEPEALFEKIVIRRRGGFCFELNALFGNLLRALGYEVTDCFSRVLRGESTIPKRRHQVLLVGCEESEVLYLVDVGITRGTPLLPIALSPESMLDDGVGLYRFRNDLFLGWILQEKLGSGWSDVYSFTLEPQLPVDFITTSYFCEHAPQSPFNKEPMVALRTPSGRLTRSGNEFRRFDKADVQVIIPKTQQETEALMQEWFGL